VSQLTDIQDTLFDNSSAASAAPPRHYAFSRSRLEVKDGVWRLRTREAGYRETGVAVGRLLATAGYPGVRAFGTPFARVALRLAHALTRRDFARIRIPGRYLDELRGYAEGSGLPYTSLFFMNFVFDILKKYGFHCSSVAITEPDATLVGRNTDLIPWIAKAALRWFPPVVLDVAVPGKLRYVHVTPGLFLGVLGGFNEHGIAMMSHQIAATRERTVPGNLATTLLQRMILEEATDMASAERVIFDNPIQRCIADLVTSRAENASRIYEISPTSVKKTAASETYLCCATHFQDRELSLLQRYKTTISAGRLALMNALAAKIRAVPEEVIALLRNEDNGRAHVKSGRSPTNAGTYQSIVFDLVRRRLFVANGERLPVSLTGTYREIVIDDE
jgi:Acyl-coenzyme A:6-aminopenicillanic acid acyl-transferase